MTALARCSPASKSRTIRTWPRFAVCHRAARRQGLRSWLLARSRPLRNRSHPRQHHRATPRQNDAQENAVGKLADDFTTIDFKHPNTEDCALFEIDSAGGTPSNRIAGQDRSISEFDGRTPAQLIASKVETELYGIHTQGQPGKIFASQNSFVVKMLKPDMTHANATFTNVVAYHTPCQEGDSGGAVLEKGTGNLLGMHFAGVPGFGLFIPAGPMFTNHGLKLFA